jgi:predicted nucleic acid-binding protein
MISFDTNVLVYATASISDVRAMQARHFIGNADGIGVPQALAVFSSVAMRKVRIPIRDIRRKIGA